jgi:hypothetical protein
VGRLLDTMSYERARQVFDELADVPVDQRGPVERRVDYMAYLGMEGHYDSTGWPHYAESLLGTWVRGFRKVRA